MDAPTTQANLTGLNEYTQYRIFVVASNRKGSGPDSDIVDIFTYEECTQGDYYLYLLHSFLTRGL